MKYQDMDKRYVGAVCARSAAEVLKPVMTSKRLLDQGICLCDECGTMCSTDYKWCWKCKRNVMILEKPLTRQEYDEIKKLKSQSNENKNSGKGR